MWEQMWSAGLGKGQKFDVGGPSQALCGELARMPKPTAALSALVPGCGRAYDALALARHGFERVVAVDISKTACVAAEKELAACGDPAAKRVEVLCADFFAMEGSYDFIWDCTFLCALDPSVRGQWASRSAKLLKPDGTLLSCVFPIFAEGASRGGPPYALSVALIRDLVEPVGLEAASIREDLPQDEQHRPGGMPGGGSGPRTALAAWRRRR